MSSHATKTFVFLPFLVKSYSKKCFGLFFFLHLHSEKFVFRKKVIPKCSNAQISQLPEHQGIFFSISTSYFISPGQGCAKLYISSRNRNQYVAGSRFRTTKSKPICIAAFFRNQNRNQYLYLKHIRNKNQNQYA